jgi:hypothetical protein
VTPLDEPLNVTDLVNRIVREARIPGQARREDLRRELLSHFEDAGGSSDDVREALRRFGPETGLGEQFRSRLFSPSAAR